MYQLFIRTVLAVLVSACLSQGIFATDQPKNDNPPEKPAAKLTASAPKSVPPQQSLSVSTIFSPTEGEPLLLLLFGLAIFVGATTLKRKKSSARSDGISE